MHPLATTTPPMTAFKTTPPSFVPVGASAFAPSEALPVLPSDTLVRFGSTPKTKTNEQAKTEKTPKTPEQKAKTWRNIGIAATITGAVACAAGVALIPTGILAAAGLPIAVVGGVAAVLGAILWIANAKKGKAATETGSAEGAQKAANPTPIKNEKTDVNWQKIQINLTVPQKMATLEQDFITGITGENPKDNNSVKKMVGTLCLMLGKNTKTEIVNLLNKRLNKTFDNTLLEINRSNDLIDALAEYAKKEPDEFKAWTESWSIKVANPVK